MACLGLYRVDPVPVILQLCKFNSKGIRSSYSPNQVSKRSRHSSTDSSDDMTNHDALASQAGMLLDEEGKQDLLDLYGSLLAGILGNGEMSKLRANNHFYIAFCIELYYLISFPTYVQTDFIQQIT
jgi:hypothetical protein